jgi:hypothetical protein
MANYNTINISKSLYESKRNAYDMGQDGNQSYIISTFAILNNISESKSKFIIHDHLFNKFLESNHSNFDSFLQKEMRYKEDGTMTGANIPQNVRPERPIDDKEEYDESLYYMKEDDEEEDSDTSEEEKDDDYEIEEDDSDTREEDDDSLENDSSDNEGQSKLTSVILKFMDDTHLSEASDDEAKLFLSRFKGVLQEVIENEYAIQLIILLLYKAKFEPENLSDGEIEELEDICFSFNNELEESDTSDEEESDDDTSDTIEESYKYKSLFEVEKNELEKSGKELSRLDRKKANKDKRKQKKQFDKNVSNTRLLKKGIDTVSKDARQGVISKTKEMYNKYPITTCLVGASLLLGAGTLAILGWYALSKYSNKKYNKAKERLINDDTRDNIINGDTQAIQDNIIDAEIIDRSDTQDSDTSNDTSSEITSVDDYPQSTINPDDSGSSDTSLDTNIDTDDEESDANSDEEQDIDIEDDNTRVELDSDTMNEIEDFDLDIEEIQSNESEIKSELVTQTKEELNNNPELKQQIDNRNKKKREYVKTNKDYWGKDKVSQDKNKKDNKDNKKGDTSKDKKPKEVDNKKPIQKTDSKTMGSAKKKPDVIQAKNKDTKKSDTSNKKPVDKKSDTSKKGKETKPNISQVKKGDTSKKKPIEKKKDTSNTKPKPNENIDAYKKRTGKAKLPTGYYKDKNNRIQIDKKKIKKKEHYENEYKFLIF